MARVGAARHSGVGAGARALLSAAAAAWLVAGGARAAQAPMAVAIGRGPLKGQVLQLASQARVSLSLRVTGRCVGGVGQPLSGRLSFEAALDELLKGSAWTWRRLAPGTYLVGCRPPAPPAPVKPPEPAPAASVELGPVVVIATKRPSRAESLAYALSGAETPTLLGQGVGDLSDLAQLTPGMTVTNLGTGRDKVLLRGLSDGPLTGRAQSMVGLYLDDVRLTYNAPDPDLRLVDMAQVEVLRGPQAALYGAGSLGGVIEMVTAPPDPTRRAGFVSASVGSTETAADSHVFEAMLNAPLFDGRAAVRAVAYDDLQGGYIKDSYLRLDDVNRSDRSGARLALKADLAQGWDLTLGLVDQAINAKDTQYALAAAPAYTRANRVREPHDNDFNAARLGLHASLGGVEAQWTLAYIVHGLYSRYDATQAPPIPLPSGPAAFDDHDQTATLQGEATFTSSASARVQWTAGLFVARSMQATTSALTVLNATPLLALAERRHDRLDEAAAYGEVVLPVTAAVHLTLGGRLFASNLRTESADVAPLAGTATSFNGGLGRAGFAPKVVASYRPDRRWLVYAQAAEGYRAGGFNTLGPPGQAFGETTGLQPFREYGGDELWSFEAGAKLTLLSGRLRLHGAAFQEIWKNIQSDLLLPSGLPFTANLGDGGNRGVELEGGFRQGGLELRTDAVVQKPELDRANPSFPTRPEFGLAVVPDLSLGASARYVRPLSGGRSIELDGRWRYVGGSRLVLDATTAPAMGDYATGRLAAAFVDGPWRWTLALDNPLDSRGDTFAYGNPFNVRSAPEVTPLRPRTLTLGVRRDF